MKSIIQLLLLVGLTYCQDPNGSPDPDFYNNFEQIVAENGFALETHKVHTADGYINTVFRIPGSVNEKQSTGKKPPVLLQHGILDSADCWVMNWPNVAPAFVLSRAGYDVWLGNSRGNRYSNEHETLDPSGTDYWQFDWQEMGDYDLPALLEYIRAQTGFQKTAYIAHSQGTTQMFYALAHNEPYFAQYVSIFLAFGPVLQLSHCKSDLLTFVAENDELIVDTCELFGIYDMFPANWIDTGAMELICGNIPQLCEFGVYLVCDEDLDLDDSTRLNDYVGGHYPSGTSLRCLEHYAQILQAERFQYYDYGKKGNNQHYGSDTPPLINIQSIEGKVPIAMFVGKEDELADVTDAEWAHSQMSKAVVFYQEYMLGHLSFMVAKEMSWFTLDAMSLLQKYHPATSVFLQ